MQTNEILDKIVAVIGDYSDVDLKTVNGKTNIRTDLGLNSLELVNIAVAIEDEFDVEIPDREALGLETVDDCVELIKKYM